MPAYQHSCFISYKHPPHLPDGSGASIHFWVEFITAFQSKLESFLTVGLSTYRDDRLRSAPGVKYPAELSQRLCRSVCMIAILVPEYFESSWCMAEWKAMERLELERAADPTDGFIIPVLFRGDRAKAGEFCGPRMYADFSHIIKPKTQLNNIDSRRVFEDIAGRVAKLARVHSPTDCSTFMTDAGEEVVEPRFDDPDPLI